MASSPHCLLLLVLSATSLLAISADFSIGGFELPAGLPPSSLPAIPTTPLPEIPPPPTAAPPAPALGPAGGGKGFYRKMVRGFLLGHNVARSAVGLPPLSWDRRLARYARRWSMSRRHDCLLIHSAGPYGENMFMGTGWEWKAAEAVAYWVDEHADYDYEANSCTEGHICGHYTQMVWNTTTHVGCGRAECFGGGVIITCNYDPPGNFEGERPY